MLEHFLPGDYTKEVSSKIPLKYISSKSLTLKSFKAFSNIIVSCYSPSQQRLEKRVMKSGCLDLVSAPTFF